MTSTTTSIHPAGATRRNAQAKFHSFNWMRGVADDTAITVIHRFVLMRLCLHRRDDSGRCDPGANLVALETGIHRATIFRAIDAGIKAGWIAPRAHGGRMEAHYELTFPPTQQSLWGDGSAPQQSQHGDCSNDPTVARVRPNSRTGATQQSQRQRASVANSNTSTRNGRLYGRLNGRESLSPTPLSADPKRATKKKSTPDTGAAFEKFWRAYPKRVAKGAAFKAFAKATEGGTDPEALIAGAERYANERVGQEDRFTKHPATWLNGGCWEDEPAPSNGLVIDANGHEVHPPTRRRGEPRDVLDEIAAEVADEWIGRREFRP
jgi:hypothetical protein